MLILRWLYHVACRAYFGEMVKNGCPHADVLRAYIRHIAAVKDLDRRLAS